MPNLSINNNLMLLSNDVLTHFDIKYLYETIERKIRQHIMD